jgi:hypothetical protein
MGTFFSEGAQAAAAAERRHTLIFRMSSPISSGCFMFTTREPKGLIEDPSIALVPTLVAWAQKGWMDGETFRMVDGQMIALPEEGNGCRYDAFAELPAELAHTRFANVTPRVLRDGENRSESRVTSWRRPDGPSGLFFHSPPLTWEWIVADLDSTWFDIYFAKEIKVIGEEEDMLRVGMANEVGCNKEGFQVYGSGGGEILMRPQIYFGDLRSGREITSLQKLSRSETATQISRAG